MRNSGSSLGCHPVYDVDVDALRDLLITDIIWIGGGWQSSHDNRYLGLLHGVRVVLDVFFLEVDLQYSITLHIIWDDV